MTRDTEDFVHIPDSEERSSWIALRDRSTLKTAGIIGWEVEA